jgi:hypothetical protein
MSVEQADVVDAVGLEVETGKVILTISDHLDWSNEEDHELKLQDKLNTYLSFIRSGELLASYPNAKGRNPVIEVVTRVAPSSNGQEFLDRVAAVIRNAGIEFRTKVLGD